MNNEQLAEVRKIREYAEVRYGSKIPCCRMAYVVNQVLGFDIEVGWASVADNKRTFQCWNWNEEDKETIDVAADQIEGMCEKILVCPNNDVVPICYDYSPLAELIYKIYIVVDGRRRERDHKDYLKFRETGTVPSNVEKKGVSLVDFLGEIRS